MEFTKEQQLYADVIQKAWEDVEFKKNLVSNPVETIEKFMGISLELPTGKTLVVRDQSEEDTIYINIPTRQESESELNEEQLEAVAGGSGPSFLPIFGPPGFIRDIGIAPPKTIPIAPTPIMRFSE